MAEENPHVTELLAIGRLPTKRRIPQRQDLFAPSINFADATLPPDASTKEMGHVARRLRDAGALYYHVSADEAARQGKVGRPPHEAEQAFISYMHQIWWGTLGFLPRYRNYNELRGKEKSTYFQDWCRLWFKHVDPDGCLSPTDFRSAQQSRNRLNKNQRSAE